MFGLDDRIAAFSDGTTTAVVIVVAIVLGLRHAADPDHIAAVTTLVGSRVDGAARRAARLGMTWGLGHATSLFAFGLPIVLAGAYLPARVQAGAETAVGAAITALGVSTLLRWRRPARRARTARQAYAIGLVHGLGGTAGVGVLLLATIHSHVLAVAALALFAAGTTASMTLVSTGIGSGFAGLGRDRAHRAMPILAGATLLFGLWYALGAQGVVPYVL